jgi:hypothetical protein
MLCPKEEFKERLKGYIKTRTRTNINNQTIKTPFRDFTVREKPEFIELKIFMATILQ